MVPGSIPGLLANNKKKNMCLNLKSAYGLDRSYNTRILFPYCTVLVCLDITRSESGQIWLALDELDNKWIQTG